MLLLSHFAYRMGVYEYLQRAGFALVSGNLWVSLWVSDDGDMLATVDRMGTYDYRVTYS